ncbi:MAG: aminotransferase class V-fold PLP-dependent enzyme [Anaerolineae bacterium]
MTTEPEQIIYFDNAATSWPKPPQMQEAMNTYLQHVGGSPGRSGHRLSIAASRIVGDTRDALAELFGVDDPSRIAFTKNSTEALNIAIMGWLQAGDHVITSSIEHNSVMRPLRYLEAQRLIELTVLPCSSSSGYLDLADLRRALKPNTRLVVMTYASNVIGNLLPIDQIGAITRQAGIPLLVDASQTAGAYPINVEAMYIDMLAFTGHKALLGPTGTGGLYVREGIELRPLAHGGTGSRSEEEFQPNFMPDKLEAGTLNVIGLAGLGASVKFLLNTGVEQVCRHEQKLVKHFLGWVTEIPGLKVYGPPEVNQRVGLLSFNITGMSPSKVGLILDQAFGIMARIGLHCAPAAHRTLGTYPEGTVRFGFSYFNTRAEVDQAIEALIQLVGEVQHAR